MPFSDIPDPLPEIGEYSISAISSTAVPSVVSIGFAGTFGYTAGGSAPDQGDVDAFLQDLVDHLAAMPGMTEVTATKLYRTEQIVTPTEPE